MRYVATIMAYNDAGKVLFGKRRDNGKWTNIGGHVDVGESPHDAALRELKEESNLEPQGGPLEYVGEDFIKEKQMYVFVFKCPVAGEPSGVNDPDQEISEYAWFGPNEIPDDEALHVPYEKNVLLNYFVPARECAGGPAARYWKSKDDIKIPESGNVQRQIYNKSHADLIAKHFANGDKSKVKRIAIMTDIPQGFNLPANKARLSLYTRMALAGEPLPPVVVKRSVKGYSLIDGNHRQAAALEADQAQLQAFEIVGD